MDGVPVILQQTNIGWSPSYAFTSADLDGDGLHEFLSCPIGVGLLRAFDITGRTLWEFRFPSPDRIGEMSIVAADVDGDGRAEVLLPEEEPTSGAIHIVALRGDGRVWWRCTLPQGTKWYLENQVPPLDDAPPDGYASLGAAYAIQPRPGGRAVRNSILNLALAWLAGRGHAPSIVAFVRGGHLYALTATGQIRWHLAGLGDEPAHYACTGDLDGDGRDEIVVSSSYRRPDGWSAGSLYVVDADGRVRWTACVATDITAHDVHVDDALIAPILTDEPGAQLVTASGGCLFHATGRRIWRLEEQLQHGQWVAAGNLLPDHPGREIVLTQFHIVGAPVTLATSDGRIRWHYHRWHPNTMLSRACCVDWLGDGRVQIVVGEQAPYFRDAISRRTYDLTVLAGTGDEIVKLPFEDTKRADWYYNGENSAHVIDIDGDGRQEFLFPTMDGRLLIVGVGDRAWAANTRGRGERR